jgi:hypothetical protein
MTRGRMPLPLCPRRTKARHPCRRCMREARIHPCATFRCACATFRWACFTFRCACSTFRCPCLTSRCACFTFRCPCFTSRCACFTFRCACSTFRCACSTFRCACSTFRCPCFTSRCACATFRWACATFHDAGTGLLRCDPGTAVGVRPDGRPGALARRQRGRAVSALAGSRPAARCRCLLARGPGESGSGFQPLAQHASVPPREGTRPTSHP